MNFEQLVDLSARELCIELLSAADSQDYNSNDIEQIIEAIESKIALGAYMFDELTYVSRVVSNVVESANTRKWDLRAYIVRKPGHILGTAIVKGNGLELDQDAVKAIGIKKQNVALGHDLANGAIAFNLKQICPGNKPYPFRRNKRPNGTLFFECRELVDVLSRAYPDADGKLFFGVIKMSTVIVFVEEDQRLKLSAMGKYPFRFKWIKE